MMFQAVLSNRDHPEYGVATIPFPIPHDQYTYCILHHSFENFTVSATIFIIPRCAQTDKRKILCEVFL